MRACLENRPVCERDSGIDTTGCGGRECEIAKMLPDLGLIVKISGRHRLELALQPTCVVRQG